MTIKELIAILEGYDSTLPVRLRTEGIFKSHEYSGEITSVEPGTVAKLAKGRKKVLILRSDVG